jgi:DNA-3-methyladenine glycosylase I
MEKLTGYCAVVVNMEKDNVHVHYHDKEYGFPIEDDNGLFARLILEINQAGLSWTTILKKKDNFFRAFDDFDIGKVAHYGPAQRERLLADPGIIRNRLKVDATIGNAKTIQKLQKEYGSFKKWLDHHHPMTKEEWVQLFKKTFRFTGGEIVGEFLMSAGYLPGAHVPGCPIYDKVLKHKPAWTQKRAVEKILTAPQAKQAKPAKKPPSAKAKPPKKTVKKKG